MPCTMPCLPILAAQNEECWTLVLYSAGFSALEELVLPVLPIGLHSISWGASTASSRNMQRPACSATVTATDKCQGPGPAQTCLSLMDSWNQKTEEAGCMTILTSQKVVSPEY